MVLAHVSCRCTMPHPCKHAWVIACEWFAACSLDVQAARICTSGCHVCVVGVVCMHQRGNPLYDHIAEHTCGSKGVRFLIITPPTTNTDQTTMIFWRSRRCGTSSPQGEVTGRVLPGNSVCRRELGTCLFHKLLIQKHFHDFTCAPCA